MRTRLTACFIVAAAVYLCVRPGLVHAADASLYHALGDKPGIAALMNDFTQRLKSDARVGRFFAETKPAGLAEQLVEQVCQASGGPCNYEGATMVKSHQDLQIARADFNAVVEVLQQTMDAHAVPFATQNRLLALLAPMHREIVTR